MNQEQVIVLLLKIVLVSGAVSVALFVAEYTWRTRGAAWRNTIGRTLLWKDVLLILCLVPSILSLFLHFNRLTSSVAAWVDVGLFALLTPAMWWRIVVFERIHRDKPQDTEHAPAGGGEDEAASLCCVLSPGVPGLSSPPASALMSGSGSGSAAAGRRRRTCTSGG